MKRIFTLILSFLALTGAFTAQADFQYRLAGDTFTGVGTGQGGTNYSTVLHVPAEVSKQMAGSQIKSVTIGFGSGVAKTVTVFITKDLGGDPVYTQTGSVKAQKLSEVALTTPYTIDGGEFYIGYDYRQSTSSGNPIGFDGNKAGANEYFDMIAVYSDGGEKKYEHLGSQFGNASLFFTITGDNLPTSSVLPSGINMPIHSLVGEEFTYTVTIRNMGNNNVNSVKLSHDICGNTSETTNTFSTPIKPGETAQLSFTGSSDMEMMNLPVKVSVTEVNGSANPWAVSTLTGTLSNSNKVSPRTVVIEEYTGVTCGYCPMGWLALESMREKYPNDYIGIAVHNYSSAYGADPMNCSAYQSWCSRWIDGAPQATANRVASIGNFQPNVSNCEIVYNEIHSMIPISLKIWAWYAEEGVDTKLNTRVATTFEGDIDNLNYGLAWVITEDNVGPYNQSNYFAGGSYGAMGGFENKSSTVSLMFNDVARNIFHWNGLTGSIPTKMTAGNTHYTDFEMPIAANGTIKHADTNIIALLINKGTGEIVTAAKCKIGKDPTSGVNNVVTDKVVAAEIKAIRGGVKVEGAVKSVEIYTLAGIRVASAGEGGTFNLPAGIYLVRAIDADNKATASKVVVR